LVAIEKGQEKFERLRDLYVGALDLSGAAKSTMQAGQPLT